MSPNPLIFISHKHKNDKLADALYGFLTERCLGGIEVFSSSRAESKLTPGGSVSVEIGDRLSEAEALVLIYTSDVEDWSYCMYEAGLAVDPKTPKTRVILFKCGAHVPSVFSDSVYIDIHNQADVLNFVISLFTTPDFFPGRNAPLAPDFKKDSPELKGIAEDLGNRLREAAPPLDEEPATEWPSFDALTLEAPAATLEAIAEGSAEEHFERVGQEFIVVASDTWCPRLFGMREIQYGHLLGDLFGRWQQKNKKADPKWWNELQRQLIEAARDNFPKIRFVPMSSSDRRDRYLPSVHLVRSLPATACKQFEIYFLPLLEKTSSSDVPPIS